MGGSGRSLLKPKIKFIEANMEMTNETEIGTLTKLYSEFRNLGAQSIFDISFSELIWLIILLIDSAGETKSKFKKNAS